MTALRVPTPALSPRSRCTKPSPDTARKQFNRCSRLSIFPINSTDTVARSSIKLINFPFYNQTNSATNFSRNLLIFSTSQRIFLVHRNPRRTMKCAHIKQPEQKRLTFSFFSFRNSFTFSSSGPASSNMRKPPSN